MSRNLRRVAALAFGLGAGLPVAIRAQATDTTKAAPLDGPNRPMRDSLLEHLVGHWRVTRQRTGQADSTSADVDWVLNHQFVRLHYHDAAPTAASYEAMVLIGRDNTSDRYVVHWLDLFGGRSSETLGYGTPVLNGIRFVFEYPDGPFVNTFTFDRGAGQWSTLMRQKNARGEWTTFATERFTRAASPPSARP